MSTMKYLMFKDSFFLLKTAYSHVNWPTNWNGLTNSTKKYVHDIRITLVHWSKPTDMWIKLNTDGSSLSDGRIGVGGIMRNREGEFSFGYSTPLGEGSNNQAEMGVALLGITWCLQLGYTRVILEVESQLVINASFNRLIHPGI